MSFKRCGVHIAPYQLVSRLEQLKLASNQPLKSIMHALLLSQPPHTLCAWRLSRSANSYLHKTEVINPVTCPSGLDAGKSALVLLRISSTANELGRTRWVFYGLNGWIICLLSEPSHLSRVSLVYSGCVDRLCSKNRP